MFKQTFDQHEGKRWITAVQVATVWTEPQSAREIDTPGTTNPTNIREWLSQLNDGTRLALCDENRVQTQLLYGEEVEVIDVAGDWAKIVIPTQPSRKDERGYPGWVPFKQLTALPANEWFRAKTAVIVSSTAWLEEADGEPFLEISYLTALPVINVIADRIKVKTPHGDYFIPKEHVHIYHTEKGMEQRTGADIVDAGKLFLGLAYFWGGMSAFGYDCSGFAYAMHKANGYQIPRDASDQAEDGENIPLDQLLPGDLLFFAYEEGKGSVHHVGIYVGEDQMIHAPKTGKSIEITSWKNPSYHKELFTAKRYWKWR